MFKLFINNLLSDPWRRDKKALFFAAPVFCLKASKKPIIVDILLRMRTTLHGFYFWLENVLGGSVRDQKRASISGWFESTWRDRVLIISK